MSKLEKYEIELLKVVKSCQPSGVAVIHDQCEGGIKDTQLDLGRLYNSGHLTIKHKQYSVTQKGESVLAGLLFHKTLKLPERAELPKNDLVIMEKTGSDAVAGDIECALNDLERQLNVEPVTLTPVEQYELKCEVIDRLSNLLDPSISSILEDIKQDVTHLHEKAA